MCTLNVPVLALVVVALGAVGCSAKIQPLRSSAAQIEYQTQISRSLKALPPPAEKIYISVYKFRDQSGQYKPGTGTTGWSTAVTQGATSMLIKALQDDEHRGHDEMQKLHDHYIAQIQKVLEAKEKDIMVV